MANISLLSRLVNGVQRNVDLSVNTLVVGALQITASGNILTNTILGNLINLQNGTDFSNGTNSHTHDGRYYTKTQIGSTTGGTAGSTLVGDDASYTHFTPSAATVKGALSGIDSALGAISAASALDGTFRIKNTADNTKQIAFDASAIATGTTRTITMPNSNVNLGLVATAIQANGSVTFTAAQSFGGFNATNLADPVNPQDAVTKNYADNLAHGLSWKMVVRAASTANLNLASMPATVDGVTLNSGDRFLAKDQTTTSQNGIYVFNGAASAATRSTDANTAVELTWATVEIGADSATQAGYIYREASDITTIGTDPVTFILISHGLDWTFNNGLSTTGNQVNVVPGDNSLTATTGSLVVKEDAAGAIVTGASGIKVQLAGTNPGLAITSNALDVKYNPAGAVVASSSGIMVAVDGSSLEISSNALRIKTTAYDQSTITGGGGSAAAVAKAPQVGTPEVSGQALSATTLVALRYAVAADSGFVAGRMYKADYDTTSADNFWAIGLAYPAGSVSIGGAVNVVEEGLINVPSHGFTVGTPVFLGASGAVVNTAPSATLQAVVKLGMVKDANNIWVNIQVMGTN